MLSPHNLIYKRVNHYLSDDHILLLESSLKVYRENFEGEYLKGVGDRPVDESLPRTQAQTTKPQNMLQKEIEVESTGESRDRDKSEKNTLEQDESQQDSEAQTDLMTYKYPPGSPRRIAEGLLKK